MKEVLITSSVLIAVLLALRFLFRKTISRRVQYALWGLVLARLLIPVSLPASPASVLNFTPAMAVSAPRASVGGGLPDAPPAVPVPTTDVGRDDLGAPSPVSSPNVGGAVAHTSAPAPSSLNLTALLPSIWFTGSALMALFFLWSNLRFYFRLRKTRIPCHVEGCSRPVYLCEALTSPCLFGLFRPAVYLTPAAVSSPERLRHVLAHEETHARHLDPLWTLLRSLCLTLYWFDPLVWAAAAVSGADCELACDEGALARLDEEERLPYGQTLLALTPIRRLPANPLLSATAMTAGKRQLRDRLVRIAEHRKTVAAALAAVLALSLLAGACTFTGARHTPSPTPREPVVLTIDEGPAAADYSQFPHIWNGGAADNVGAYDGRSVDFTRESLPDGLDRLLLLQFDDKTKWPEALPDGFDPDAIMEANKNPGLGVRALHETGVTGKGVNLGIIDQSLLLEHQEYKDNVCYYRQLDDSKYPGASMHGAAVTSIAAGKTVGVAPDANLFYVSLRFPSADEDPMSIRPFIEALNVMLDMNDTLPEGNKLDAISISRGFNETDEGWSEMKAALDRAEQAGVFVVTVSTELTHGMSIAGASHVLLSDYDDPGNVRPGLYWEKSFYQGPEYYADSLFIPMDYRATASPTGTEDYVNYVGGGMSWAVPYFAGVYCLARQVKPDVTPQEFWAAAMDTATAISFREGAQSYQIAHVINPPGIVKALEGK